MSQKKEISLINTDLYRYTRETNFISLIRCAYDNPGFTYTFWWRLCSYLIKKKISKIAFYYLCKFILSHYKYKYGIDIPIGLPIGKGLYIGHFGGIVIGADVRIGDNFNLSHGVTLGQVNRGSNKGSPTIGDNVYIGPGAKVIGNVIIGNNVAIGANCVVVKSIPDKGVVVGIPGKIVSYHGSEGYVNNTDY